MSSTGWLIGCSWGTCSRSCYDFATAFFLTACRIHFPGSVVRQPGEAAPGAVRSRRVGKAVLEAERSKLADMLPSEAPLPLGLVFGYGVLVSAGSLVFGFGVLAPAGSLPAVRVRSMFVGLAARPTWNSSISIQQGWWTTSFIRISSSVVALSFLPFLLASPTLRLFTEVSHIQSRSRDVRGWINSAHVRTFRFAGTPLLSTSGLYILKRWRLREPFEKLLLKYIQALEVY